jgi:hypothetical protein
VRLRGRVDVGRKQNDGLLCPSVPASVRTSTPLAIKKRGVEVSKRRPAITGRVAFCVASSQAAFAMGNHKYLDLAISQTVDQAEGKPGEKVTLSTSAVSWPPVRRFGYRFNGMPRFFDETACCNQAAPCIPLVGCCSFLDGRRVELTAVARR